MKNIINLVGYDYTGTPSDIELLLYDKLSKIKLNFEVYIVDRYTRTTNSGGIHGDSCELLLDNYSGFELPDVKNKLFKITGVDIYTAEEYEGSLYANSGASVYDEDPDMAPDDDYAVVVTVEDTGEEKKSLVMQWRLKAGLTQQEVADKLGIPKRTLENWEQGTRTPSEWTEKLVIGQLVNWVVSDLEFSEDAAKNAYIKACVFDRWAPGYDDAVEILLNSYSVEEFVDLYLDYDALNDTLGYAELSKLDEDGHWARVYDMLGKNWRETESDADGLKIGNDEWTILIPNGSGDGETRYGVVEDRGFNPDMMEYFTEVEGTFNIYSYDCGSDIDMTLHGRYGIYNCNGFIVFEKWPDRE